MKKYIKPELFYERYELAQHIADCQWEMNYANENSCIAETDKVAWDGYYDTLFTDQPRCNNTDWEGYCYQTGNEGDIKVFIS